MSHVREHCKTPKYWFRRKGAMWACTCGKIWVVGYFQFGKAWQPWTPPEKELS